MEHAWIPMSDGVRLAATLYLPDGAGGAPVPCLLEALPYRKDDLTASYRPEYNRFCREHGYAVARVDLRGSGSSTGIALDEYHAREQADLHEVIAWLARQPWSSGAVGMFGTSWSGFNALQMACQRPPALKAVVATHATDDRWTDDVHYQGGALRLLDQIDYPLYMVAMGGLPPAPALAGPDWRQQWLERVEGTPAWLLEWLTHQADGPYWRHGSVRATPGPAGAGQPSYERIACPTMIIAGWADGYRNNTFRTFRALSAAGTPVEVLAGPWSHMAPATSIPGPRVDHVPIMARWWDRWLRPPDPGAAPDSGAGAGPHAPFTVFIRRYARPSPAADTWPGRWEGHDEGSLDRGRTLVLNLADADRRGPMWSEPAAGPDCVGYDGALDVGLAAWNSCAGHLPWGQPLDQEPDEHRSACFDFTLPAGTVVLGHPRLRTRIRLTDPIAHLSAKLSLRPRAGSGPSLLVCRGLLNLAYRDGPVPVPAEPHTWVDVDLELDATAFELTGRDTLRLALACADWPNTVSAGRWSGLDLGASQLLLPVGAEPVSRTGPDDTVPDDTVPDDTVPDEIEADGEGGGEGAGRSTTSDGDGTSSVEWRHGHDVLHGTRYAEVDHGSHYHGFLDSTCSERYTGRVEIESDTGRQRATATARFTVAWPHPDDPARPLEVTSEARLDLAIEAGRFVVSVELDVGEGEAPVATRRWDRTISRLA